jgi:hypothetical protein
LKPHTGPFAGNPKMSLTIYPLLITHTRRGGGGMGRAAHGQLETCGKCFFHLKGWLVYVKPQFVFNIEE